MGLNHFVLTTLLEWFISPDGLPYFAVTNNPQISVTKSNKDSFLLPSCCKAVVWEGALCCPCTGMEPSPSALLP